MMCYDSATRQLILFGGARSGTDLGDTWVWAGPAVMITDHVPAVRVPPDYAGRRGVAAVAA
jgi:hypothetical protein